MLRLCNQCRCELNGENTAKKDAKRYRKICRACFREKRNRTRMIREKNQGELLDTLIETNVIKLDPLSNQEPLSVKPIIKEENKFLSRIINVIKSLMSGENNGI